jgi:hypothetical protein
MRWRGRIWVNITIVMILLMASFLSGCLKDDDDNGNGNGKNEDVLANAGTDVFGEVGTPVTFNGSTSSGPIQKYWWDVDQVNASDPLTEDLVGEEVSYTYTTSGVFVVTLTVEGKGDKTSNDTIRAYIDLKQNFSSSLAILDLNETFEFDVTEDVQKVMLTLTYPTLSDDIVPRVLLLDLDVYAGGTQPVTTTTAQPPDLGETQTEELDVPLNDLITNLGFQVVVRWQEPPLAEAPFVLDVEIFYRSV